MTFIKVMVAAICVGSFGGPVIGQTCPNSTVTRHEISRAPEIVIDTDSGKPVKSGQPVLIKWSVGGLSEIPCGVRYFLAFSFPSHSRFQGDGLLAIPARARGPYNVQYDETSDRVFIPLNTKSKWVLSGSFTALLHTPGAATVKWSIIEVPIQEVKPADSTLPTKYLVLTESNRDLSVEQGQPTIVISDQYTTDPPLKRIISNSGEFELLIYNQFYRIYDSETGILLLERNGWDPNFSPSSRFLAAFANGTGFEIFDLYTGTIILDYSELVRTQGFDGSVNAAAWASNDSFVVLSIWGWGGVHVQSTLNTSQRMSVKSPSCHACVGLDVPLFLEPNSGIVSVGDTHTTKSLVTQTLIDLDSIEDSIRAERGITENSLAEKDPNFRMQLWALDRLFNRGGNYWSQETGAKMRRQFISAATNELHDEASRMFDMRLGQLAEEQSFDQRRLKQPGWQLGGGTRLSHQCSVEAAEPDKLTCQIETTDKQKAKELISQRRLLRVDHRIVSSSLITRQNLGSRWGSPQDFDAGKPAYRAKMLARMASLGLDLQNSEELAGDIPKVKFDKLDESPEIIMQHVYSSLPAAIGMFKVPKDIACGWWDRNYNSIDSPAANINPRWVKMAWRWSIQGKTIWLIHASCAHGATSRNWLFLLKGDREKVQLVDLSFSLKEILNSDSDSAIDGGAFRLWPATVQPKIVQGKYLVAWGAWGRAKKGWILTIDVDSGAISLFNKDVFEPKLVSDWYLHLPSRSVVQVNSNGRIYVYSLADGTVVLRGSYIDDELVLFTDTGYFDSTPEGAQFVSLKFPGTSGQYAFSQFKSTLYRPDLIRTVLMGDRPVHVDLPAPPTMLAKLENVKASNNGEVALVIRATSSAPIKAVLLLEDGHVVQELSPRETSTNIYMKTNLTTQPESRWVTAIAFDALGHSSAPQSIRLPASSSQTKPSGHLHLFAIGTDTYDDQSLPKLYFARADAQRFSAIASSRLTAYYGRTSVHKFLDDPELRTSVTHTLSTVAKKADRKDTIMIFISGHGLKDRKGFYVATRNTKGGAVISTALAFEEIVESMKDTKARVVVFLDACHSGAAGTSTNDEVADVFLQSSFPIVVIAASKGREFSEEQAGLAGGVFTVALLDIMLNRSAFDRNKNGVIELSELYGALKYNVLRKTEGRQTPWVARNQMFGQVPIF